MRQHRRVIGAKRLVLVAPDEIHRELIEQVWSVVVRAGGNKPCVFYDARLPVTGSLVRISGRGGIDVIAPWREVVAGGPTPLFVQHRFPAPNGQRSPVP